ncbi:MAG TPA: gamma-glutamyltransferase family protein, partial [Euryarchaeota archaeon]|nr:gamma-glutamyltransferase family protein [Euryarchaeota archaeon]
FKVVYWIRDNFVSDPTDMTISIEKMLTDDFLEEAKQKYTDMGEKYNKGDTTYFAIVDTEETIVSGIQSLFYPFGSAITEPNYGITLNARASSFVLDKNHVNSLKPKKRPLHTLSAMIIEDENRTMALGLSGGHFRPQLHAEIYANIFHYGMDVQEAIEHPRFIWHLWTDKLELEEGFDLDGLKNYDIKIVPYPSRLGVVAAAEIINDKVRAGYCDIRGDGIPIGL